MRKIVISFCFCLIFLSCKTNQPLAQSTSNSSSDTLIQIINKSKRDTGHINTELKKLAKENDLIIAYVTSTEGWSRTETHYVLASKNRIWTLYSYRTSLFSESDTAIQFTSTHIQDSSAENIKHLYALSGLWRTNGDERDDKFCNDDRVCMISDDATCSLTVATPQNIHTTTYYAPDFFESCCPGNPYRHSFVAIVKEIEKLAGNINSM